MTEEQMVNFLTHLESTGLEATARRRAGVKKDEYLAALERNADFNAQVQETLNYFYDAAEIKAYERAFDGVEKDVYYQGAVVGQEVQYSDTLAAMFLKAYRPDKFKDRKELTGKNGGKVEIAIVNFDEEASDLHTRRKDNMKVATVAKVVEDIIADEVLPDAEDLL